jgi:hypothetical protein
MDKGFLLGSHWVTVKTAVHEKHVVPGVCGEPSPSHELSENCQCNPYVERFLNGDVLVVHHGDH